MPTTDHLGVGDYLVRFPKLGMPFGYAMVSAFGTPPQHCTIGSWFPIGTDQVVRVNCSDAAALNNPADVWALNVSFTR